MKVWRVNGNRSERTAEARDVNGNKKRITPTRRVQWNRVRERKKHNKWERYNAVSEGKPTKWPSSEKHTTIKLSLQLWDGNGNEDADDDGRDDEGE